MKTHAFLRSVAALLASAGGIAWGGVAGPGREQIEADWLRQEAVRHATATRRTGVRPEQDAAGAVDGIKNGQWGFHTQHEPNPWWQVDLGSVANLDRLRLWNRCDGTAERNSNIRVLLSEDGSSFQQAYENPGLVFQGFPDQQPLQVNLNGVGARYVRLTLAITNYLHLDEVEIFATGGTENIALGKPATQSSVSQWSVNHFPPQPPKLDVRRVVERGLKLAESQRRLGVQVTGTVQRLREIERQLSAECSDEIGRELYVQARRLVRDMALANPLLNFNSILFAQKAPTAFPHMSDQHYGWWSRPGGGICVLDNFKRPGAELKCLTAALPVGSYSNPELSYDGSKVLFSYCRFYPELHAERNKADKANVPPDAFYHLYELNIDGTGLRQLTSGRYDDFDAKYLPNGDIVFLSTRKGRGLQVTREGAEATRHADLPDSYVRCGGDNWRPVPVFTLHAMDGHGQNLRPLSAFENFEWTPSVGNDGRLLFTRWDYIDRFNGHFFSLWSANQDGTNPQLVYGNYTVKPQVVIEARSVPRSRKLVFTASAHHSITGGSLCLLDRDRGLEEQEPLTRITPEVCFPETEGWPQHYYANPWPLSEEYFLVGWADAPLPPHRFVTDASNPTNAMGLYLLDVFGNLELLYRDPNLSSLWPMPLAKRERPPVQAELADWQGAAEGAFLVQDIYRGLDPVTRGSIRQLRIVAVPPKVQPHMNTPSIGVSAEDPGKYVLGQVPIEQDGSAHFRVPSGVPVFFQALDAQGLAVQTMRSLSYVLPGQTLSCVGCHEHRDSAPPLSPVPLAALRAPSRLTPGPVGSWPLSFATLVQPILDAKCARCHRPGGESLEAEKLDLSPGKAFDTLLTFGGEDLKKLAFEKDRSLVGQGAGANSRLWQRLTRTDGGHEAVTLTQKELECFSLWMDTYAQRQGHFSDGQEQELRELRSRLATLLAETPPRQP